MAGVGITDRFKLKAHGEMAGSATAVPFTSVLGAHWVKFKAKKANTAVVAVAQDAAITLPAGTTTATAGWELAAGQETDWLPVGGDLASWYYIGTDANQHVQYMVL